MSPVQGKAATITIKKDEKGGRDPKGKKKKNEKVRDANKQQRENPDPNASKSGS